MLGEDRLTVRRLEVPDLHALFRIMGDCRREDDGERRVNIAFEASDRGLFETYRRRRSAYFVALVDGQIVGGAGISRLADCDGAICELQRMYLRRSFRGLGIGRALLEKCLDTARDLAYECCYAEATSKMTTAINLYERRGFQRLPQRLALTGQQPQADTWMLLKLPGRRELL